MTLSKKKKSDKNQRKSDNSTLVIVFSTLNKLLPILTLILLFVTVMTDSGFSIFFFCPFGYNFSKDDCM